MKIEFLPEAKMELDEAVEYYELQVKGLGTTFKSVAKSTIKRVATPLPLGLPLDQMCEDA